MLGVRGLHTTARTARIFRIHWWPHFKRWQDLEAEEKSERKEQQILRSAFRLSDEYYISPEKPSDVLPQKPLEDQTRRDSGALPLDFYTNHTQLRYVDHSFDNIRRVKRYEHFQLVQIAVGIEKRINAIDSGARKTRIDDIERLLGVGELLPELDIFACERLRRQYSKLCKSVVFQYDQRFIAERLLFLGADLGAAHFLVHRGATVKFVGDSHWYKRGGDRALPGRKVEGMYIEAIDASGTELMYEGFDNLYDLHHLRMLRLANCKYIDDWALSRIGGALSASLELLDLSGCSRISEKGLLGLRSLAKLRELRLDGFASSTKLSKSALLLEEALPQLEVSGLDYEGALHAVDEENRLLEEERALIDARGNVFIEDDEGSLFYVAGKVNERATVNEEDIPIMTSTVRRDLPAMSEAEFERLDQLSNGRLRHLLVGSPSGYMWSDQVETILAHEAQLNLKSKTPTDPKMLPAEQRIERLKSLGVDVERLVDPPPKRDVLEAAEGNREIEAKA